MSSASSSIPMFEDSSVVCSIDGSIPAVTSSFGAGSVGSSSFDSGRASLLEETAAGLSSWNGLEI